MLFSYALHEEAYKEYIKAYEWYESQVDDLSARFMNNVEAKLQQIIKQPEYFGKRHANFREAKVRDFPYMIAYEILSDKHIIHIAAIYHIKRNPKVNIGGINISWINSTYS
ncbi:MAG: Plasmid stabilization system protein [Mucilaginibacter sp.]|nr:Plasmid stabilization system protein [Mucilaginibacter sp.]